VAEAAAVAAAALPGWENLFYSSYNFMDAMPVQQVVNIQ